MTSKSNSISRIKVWWIDWSINHVDLIHPSRDLTVGNYTPKIIINKNNSFKIKYKRRLLPRRDSDSKLFRSMLITSMIGMIVGTCHSAMMSSSWSTVKSPATNPNSLESNMHRIKQPKYQEHRRIILNRLARSQKELQEKLQTLPSKES